MQRYWIVIALAAPLSACSSGVVQMEKNTYLISEKAGGCGFATAGGQEADAYRKANQFCADKGMEVETISTQSKTASPSPDAPALTLSSSVLVSSLNTL